MIVIELAHDLPVPVNQRLHAIALAQQFIPVHSIELEGLSFSLHPILSAPTAEIPCVVMQCPTENRPDLPAAFAGEFFEEAARPLPVIDVRS